MLAYLIVLLLILLGMWVWVLLWNVKLAKLNERLRIELCQVQKEIQQCQQQSSQPFDTQQKPPLASAEQPEQSGEVDNTHLST